MGAARQRIAAGAVRREVAPDDTERHGLPASLRERAPYQPVGEYDDGKRIASSKSGVDRL